MEGAVYEYKVELVANNGIIKGLQAFIQANTHLTHKVPLCICFVLKIQKTAQWETILRDCQCIAKDVFQKRMKSPSLYCYKQEFIIYWHLQSVNISGKKSQVVKFRETRKRKLDLSTVKSLLPLFSPPSKAISPNHMNAHCLTTAGPWERALGRGT